MTEEGVQEVVEVEKEPEQPAPAPTEAALPPGMLVLRISPDGNDWTAQYSIGRLALLKALEELYAKIAAANKPVATPAAPAVPAPKIAAPAAE